jgi:delta-1-pyrroline-5-carboxylate synthetase
VSANQGYNTFGRGFSDNDSLAGGVASALKADLLILLTDVDGCYDLPPSDPAAKRISVYDAASSFKEGDKSDQGRGGMAAKVDAAVTACKSGVKAVVIASGHSADTVQSVIAGQDRGTLFLASRLDEISNLNNSNVNDEDATWINDAPVLGEKNNHIDGILKGMPAISEAPGPMESGKAEILAQECREAGRNLQSLSSAEREEILMNIAAEIDDRQQEILAVNALDVEKAQRGESGSISLPNLKRFAAHCGKTGGLVRGYLRSIARQKEPVGALQSRTELSDGLVLDKISCPIGVLLVIFESRPDCLPQIASLAIRSANGLLLKGGKEAELSNSMLADLISGVIEKTTEGKVSGSAVSLVKSRDEIKSLLALDEYIDLCIPRGSGSMVKYIQENTRMPVMGHAEGICHIYVDDEASLEKACRIVVDAKIDYPSACNAVETLLLHRTLLKPTKAVNGHAIRVSPAQAIISHLVEAGVEVNGSEEAVQLNLTTTLNLDFKTEYGALGITVHVVDDMDSAISHIHKYGSGHTESIITENHTKAETFLRKVDGACVMHNASTRFADGYRFGLGAEVGISTGRIHARGPVGVEGLLTSKWQLRSEVKKGHTVADFSTKQPKEQRLDYTHRNIM